MLKIMLKKNPGFRELLKDIPQTESLSLKKLEDFLKNIHKKRNPKWKGVTYHTGFFEDGTEYEYWNINGIFTGRGGYELFNKALQEECKKHEQSISFRSSKRTKNKPRKSKSCM